MQLEVILESAVVETPRVEQVRGLFDIEPGQHDRLSWSVALPLGDQPWHIGLIHGPSGCGKSTIARKLWPDAFHGPRLPSGLLATWPEKESILDAFPEAMSIKEIVALLSSVGFSSPPAWLRPYRLLSTGQQFRAETARRIAFALHTTHPLVVFDEFTSTVDRTVAQIGSAAVAKAIRKHNLRFVAVTCHEDVLDWLQPDWTYNPSTNRFDWRLLQRRPGVALTLFRCQRQAWQLFAPHHYLSDEILPSAVCFLATWRNAPVAFSAWLPFVGKSNMPVKREHRTVCLPDCQGVGIGNAVSDAIASMWAGLGFKPTSTTTHPAMIASRRKSPHWRMCRAPGIAKPGDIYQHANTRLTAGFEYVGPAMSPKLARLLCAA